MARADKKMVNKLVETGNYLAVVSDLADCHCVEQVRLKRLKEIEYCLKALECTDAEPTVGQEKGAKYIAGMCSILSQHLRI